MFGHLSLHSLLYADDLVIIAETCDLLKDKLLVLQEWCETNKLHINPHKSAIIHFRPSDQPKVKSMIKLGNMTYQITSDYKYLGIVLHEHLSYTQAAQMRIDHAMKVFWSLCAHTTDMSTTVFKKLYDSLITTVLDYGATIWFHQIPDYTLEKVQNKALRFF